MTRVEQLTSLSDLIKLWPRLCSLRRGGRTSENVLQLMLTCLQDGAVFLVYGDYGLVGSSCVTRTGDCVVLHSLPRDGESQLGKACLHAIEEWAREHGMTQLTVTTDRWTGSSFKYFEKGLGFERRSVTFVKEL